MNAYVMSVNAYAGYFYVHVALIDSGSNLIGPVDIQFPLTTNTLAGLKAGLATPLNQFCTDNSLATPSSIVWLTEMTLPSGLSNAPQAAITNAPADATTNYNTVTTLLGALTGAVNTANAKQNDIATKLNTLLGELRTLGLISA